MKFETIGLVDNDNTFENDFAYPKKYLDLLDVTIDQHLSHQYSKTDNKKKYLAVAGTVGWPGRLLPQNTIFLMHQPITHSSGYSAVVCTEPRSSRMSERQIDVDDLFIKPPHTRNNVND